MKRYGEIDILKGVAVICMIIFHTFYFPNQYGFKEIRYDTTLLKIIAKIAQIIFIISVGINLYLSKISSNEKNETKSTFTKKSLLRILIKITEIIFKWVLWRFILSIIFLKILIFMC